METKDSFIRIVSPEEGAFVPWRPLVEGTTKDPAIDVWVVIHPMHATEYWVQPRISVKETGSWKVQVYVGRPGNLDTDRRYEIMAVGNTKTNLTEGGVLNSWPEAEYCSQVIEVVRKTEIGHKKLYHDKLKIEQELAANRMGSVQNTRNESTITEDVLKRLTFKELLQKLSIGAWVSVIIIFCVFTSGAFKLGALWEQYKSQKDKVTSEKNPEVGELKKEIQMLRDKQSEIPLTVFDKTTGNKLHIEKPISHPGYYEFPIILHDGKNSIRIDQYYFAKRMGIKLDGE